MVDRYDRLLGPERRTVIKALGTAGFAVTIGSGSAVAQAEDTVTDDDGPTEIADWNDLDAVRNNLDGKYKLVANLDANTAGYNKHVADLDEGWKPIDNFAGIFEGDNYTISDLTIDRPDKNAVGIFGVNSGTIKNLNLANVNVTGNLYVGGLAGEHRQNIIEACSVEGSVIGQNAGGLVGGNRGSAVDAWEGTIVGSSADATVTGGDVGGLVGVNGHEIRESSATGYVDGDEFAAGGLVGRIVSDSQQAVTQCFASGDVVCLEDAGGLVGSHNGGSVTESYATGDVVSEEANAGGLVGDNRSDVTNVYATGDVTGSRAGSLAGNNFSGGSISSAYATGSVEGEFLVGGFVGDTSGDENTVKDSYWNTETANQSDAFGNGKGDTTGLTTAEMTGKAATENLSIFDFDEVWEIAINPDRYPTLQAIDTDPGEPSEEHDSGVDQELFDAVDQSGDGDVNLGELRDAVEQWGETGQINGVDASLGDLRALVDWSLS